MTAAPRRNFRTDIHGLRGLAVMLVVVYHVFVGRVSGGVDVFLFISAYFLTATFMKRLERAEPIAPVAYWGRTFKRLLPPTVVVTLATVAASLWLLPDSERESTLADAFYTLIQGQNWWLVSQAADYYAADRTVASPFQHFWSLSIQGQVFLVWPLLFALIALAIGAVKGEARARRARAVSTTVIGGITLLSFAWSVYSTAHQQQVAYFDTFARLWEFGLGALVALLLPALARRSRFFDPHSGNKRGLRFALSMLGVLVLVSMGALVDVAGLFPGWLALWPLLSAALVMVMGVNPLLSSRPFQFLGNISYGLYLVHWPLLIITLRVLGKPESGKKLGLVLVVASVGLAWLLTRFVDTPFRRWNWAGKRTHRSVGVAVASLAVGLAFVMGLQGMFAYQAAERESLAYANNPGARALDDDYTPHPDADPNAPELPGAGNLSGEWFSLPEKCEGRFAPNNPLLEDCHVRSGHGDKAEKTIAYWGNSRMEQSSSALEPLATRAGWTSLALYEGGCGPALHPGSACDAFTKASLEYLLKVKPDVVAMQTTFVPRDGQEHTTDRVETVVKRLRAEGITVIALRDQPRLSTDPVQCRENGGADACTEPSSRNMPADRPDQWAVKASAKDPGIVPVDLTETTCPNGECAPAVGNVTVFLDADHITKTYGESMQDEAARQIGARGFEF